ncbi:MAG TPA: transglycosylase SLT domain-containing protein [Acidimicrobiales bacterium]|nr:transglycosylase SLT domain-containing protein [Acidimicrobiales bacterium]
MALRAFAPAVLALAISGAVQQAAATAATPGPGGTYVIKRGETLSMVARRTGASMSSLAAANKILDVHRIRAGDRLVIPRSPVPAPVQPRANPISRLPTRLLQQPERLVLLPRFDAAAREFAIPADLLKAVTWQESGWQNDKVSSTKARGIGQLMPDTVVFVNRSLLRAQLDPGRPEHNIRMSARFLAYLLQRAKGDVPTALSSYYQGLRSVQERGPYPSTLRYVHNVLALRSKF